MGKSPFLGIVAWPPAGHRLEDFGILAVGRIVDEKDVYTSWVTKSWDLGR